jgi:hypothetical protein
MSNAKKSTIIRSKSKKYDRITITEDVYLYQTVAGTFSDYSVHYDIECNRFTALSFTLDFSSSTNINVYRYDEHGKGPEVLVPTMTFFVVVKPFSTVRLGYYSRSRDGLVSVVPKFVDIKYFNPDEKATELYLTEHRADMIKRLEQGENANFPLDRDDVDGAIVETICQQMGGTFIDLSFPPCQQSVFHPSQLSMFLSSQKQKTFEQIQWRRPIDFMKPSSKGGGDKVTIRVFEDGIEAADILQGSLGDCWFLSSLTALAEHPPLVEALVPAFSRDYHESGVYFVRFCKNGLWTTVRVDDYFPCFPDSGPIFSKSHGNELWVLLVEKAYAKLHGSYFSIQSGQSYEALMDLTGAPYQTILLPTIIEERNDRSKMDILWNKLMDGMKNHYLISVGTRSYKEFPKNSTGGSEDTEESKENAIGLAFNHSYTVLSVRESSKGDRILKLR